MPRPQKPRNVCQMPFHNLYGPYNQSQQEIEAVHLMVDELETIRLIDFEEYNQEEAAKQMNVARTTIQRIYNDARKKIADALINGKKIMIEGGRYILCDENCDCCERPRRQRNMGLGRGMGGGRI